MSGPAGTSALAAARWVRRLVALSPPAAVAVALAGSAGGASAAAGSAAPASAAPKTAAPPLAAPTAAPATAPAVVPAPVLPGTDRRLLPDTLPGGAPSAAPAAPAAPAWKAGVGAPEPARLTGHGPSTILIPVQTIPLEMNHKFHLKFVGCNDCHTKAATSKWSTDWLIPAEAQCTDCHAIDRADFTKHETPGAACVFCHRGFDPASPAIFRVSLPPPHIKFPHDKHVARGFACERCHAGMKEVTFADRDQLPKMALCLECHNGKVAPDACSTCHFTEKDGKLKVEWPEGTLTPADALRGMAHVPGWEFVHDEIASTDAATCMACHREEECAICHDGVMRPPSIHPGDYALKHAVEARRSDPDCSSCHRLQTFCLSCHTRMGVSLASALFADGRSPSMPFHPPLWNAPVASAAPVHHSTEARKNMSSCVGCHREKDCIRCHADFELLCTSPGSPAWCSDVLPPAPFGGGLPLVNPHPSSFAKICKRFMKRNVTACLRCHTPPYLEASGCAE